MRQLLLTRRFIRNNLKLSLINLLCLAIGLVTVEIITGFVYQEFNYDTDIKNSDRIFRVIRKDRDMRDPYTGVIALGIALLTVSWQSWRAARRNPVDALRYE